MKMVSLANYKILPEYSTNLKTSQTPHFSLKIVGPCFLCKD